jgi:hypothetical protein
VPQTADSNATKARFTNPGWPIDCHNRTIPLADDFGLRSKETSFNSFSPSEPAESSGLFIM